MGFISDLCGLLVSITIIVGLPIGIVWLIVATVKKSNKKIPRNILLGCCASIVVFTLIGSSVWSQTEEGRISLSQKNENTEKESEMSEEETETQTETRQEVVAKDEQENQEETNTESKIETNSEENPIDEGNTEVETETIAELTEEEYKAMCEELYYDDFFDSAPEVGKLVKAHVMAAEKYKYTKSSNQGILVKDITEEYGLALNSLGCCVMHEETKDDVVPSYFGKQIYLMFIEGAELNLDSITTGQKIVIYGEMIQDKNGSYILLKYYEEE